MTTQTKGMTMAKKDKAEGLTVKMTKKRDTKGTYVYGNEDEGSAIRSLYITKSAVDGEPPASITVVIAEIEPA